MIRNDKHKPQPDAFDNETDTSRYAIPWTGPAIMLVDLDAFFASVEQLDHPSWRGKPVIVGGDPMRHGVVSTASYEARTFGVRSAMPSSTAARLCPNAIWTQGRFDRYREVSAKVMAILKDESPYVEQVSIDEAFIDVSPTPRDRCDPVAIASRIQERVSRIGITCSIGLGTCKSVAKIASEMDKPNGLTVVYPHRERAFLSPLPIRSMSGIGPVSAKKLADRGIRTLGDVARADEDLLTGIFGKNAGLMRARCLGEDVAVVETLRDVKSISSEMTFSDLLSERAAIEAAIASMAAKVGRRLRKKELRCSTITLKLRYEDRSGRSAQKALARATDDDLLLLPLLISLLDDLWTEGISVLLVGVGASGFEEEETIRQETLFDDTSSSPEARTGALADGARRAGLIAATDRIRDRFGEEAVAFGREIKTRGKGTGTGSQNPENDDGIAPSA